MLGGRKQRRDFEQGTHALEFGACARMQPSKAAYSMKAGWQNVLEEAAKELEGFKLNMPPSSCAALAKGPEQSPIGQESEFPVASGGFEYVTAQIA